MPFEVRIALESTMGKLTDRTPRFTGTLSRPHSGFSERRQTLLTGSELENAFCPQEEALILTEMAESSPYLATLNMASSLQTRIYRRPTVSASQTQRGAARRRRAVSPTVAEKETQGRALVVSPLDAAQLADFTAAFDDSALTAKWLCVAIMMSFIALMCVYAYFTKVSVRKMTFCCPYR